MVHYWVDCCIIYAFDWSICSLCVVVSCASLTMHALPKGNDQFDCCVVVVVLIDWLLCHGVGQSQKSGGG